MHLVFLNQYYPPDVAPTGVMLESVVENLVGNGHEVTVICAEGGYAEGRHQTSRGKTQEEEDGPPACALERSTINSRPSALLSVIRLRASRFGRGTFIGKLADYASYYLGAAWTLLRLNPRPGRIIALTTPPYLSVLARLVSKLRGADHAHWVMDLYPDVMVAHGMLAEGGWKHRLLAGLARWSFGGDRCAAIVTLGPDMADRVRKVISDQSSVISEEVCGGVSATVTRGMSPIHWVPLWGSDERSSDLAEEDRIESPLQNLRHKRGWRVDERIVMYSGNMGLGHRFGEFLGAARRLDIEHRNDENLSSESTAFSEFSCPINDQPSTSNSQLSPNFRFVFYGAGKRRREIEDFIREYPDGAVELHDYAPAEELAEHLLSADVHLASLDAAWTGTMVPSKLQGIFAVGRPVIFVGSPESSIGRWVAESGGGWVVEPDDVEGLLGVLDEAGDPDAVRIRGAAAGEFAKQYFDKDTNSNRVAEIFSR